MKHNIKFIEHIQEEDILLFCYMLEKNKVKIEKVNLMDQSLIIDCHPKFLKFIQSHDLVQFTSIYFETPDFLKDKHIKQSDKEMKHVNIIASNHHSSFDKLPINQQSQKIIYDQEEKSVLDVPVLISYDHFIKHI